MIYAETNDKLYIADRAILLDHPGDRELAWAEKFVVPNPAHSYVLGKFVESDHANNNKHFFKFDELKDNTSIQYSPMNIDHNSRRVVGTYIASEMVYPIGSDADNPYVEALGVVWKAHYPDEYMRIRDAYDAGNLYFSMECVPESLTCGGDQGCKETFAYEGPTSDTYCDHISNRSSDRVMNHPHFTGGAILLPPIKPGWSNAEIHTVVAQQLASVAAEEATKCPQCGKLELKNGKCASCGYKVPDSDALLVAADWEAEMGKVMSAAKKRKKKW